VTAVSLPTVDSAALRGIALIGGLSTVVGVRWIATNGRLADGLTVGLGFGVALGALALAAGYRPVLGRGIAWIAVGLGGGVLLVAIALLAHPGETGGSGPPAATFLPWASITVLVATTEELVLRGALFTTLERRAGLTTAVLVTSIAFALMHVPFYGWHVVPLDLGVGVWLAGLRIATRGPGAPAIAHSIADLATWWL
jgi:membrane protease YdiL (CAAX protease family)